MTSQFSGSPHCPRGDTKKTQGRHACSHTPDSFSQAARMSVRTGASRDDSRETLYANIPLRDSSRTSGEERLEQVRVNCVSF